MHARVRTPSLPLQRMAHGACCLNGPPVSAARRGSRGWTAAARGTSAGAGMHPGSTQQIEEAYRCLGGGGGERVQRATCGAAGSEGSVQ